LVSSIALAGEAAYLARAVGNGCLDVIALSDRPLFG
jgi:hypothetical protein